MASDGARAPDDAVVSVENVRKVYRLGAPITVLDGVSLALPRGSYTAVMGPSGSGKSTLLNLIGCLDTPTEGRITIESRDVTALSSDERAAIRGRDVGFVFQSFQLMPRLTAVENVALPLVFQEVPRERRTERAHDLLASVGMADRADHQPAELSGGQRQRVAVARSLSGDPSIVLADEPTGSLDTDTGARIMGLLERINQSGTTVLLVTHERNIAEHAERIVHVIDGRIESVEEIGDRRRAEPVGSWGGEWTR
jgi:putative ABC transport system ATP-binding protein